MRQILQRLAEPILEALAYGCLVSSHVAQPSASRKAVFLTSACAQKYIVPSMGGAFPRAVAERTQEALAVSCHAMLSADLHSVLGTTSSSTNAYVQSAIAPSTASVGAHPTQTRKSRSVG